MTVEPIDLSLTLDEHEARYILAMLVDSRWNISEAARRLGIYRSSLQRKMRNGHLGELVRLERMGPERSKLVSRIADNHAWLAKNLSAPRAVRYECRQNIENDERALAELDRAANSEGHPATPACPS